MQLSAQNVLSRRWPGGAGLRTLSINAQAERPPLQPGCARHRPREGRGAAVAQSAQQAWPRSGCLQRAAHDKSLDEGHAERLQLTLQGSLRARGVTEVAGRGRTSRMFLCGAPWAEAAPRKPRRYARR